MPASTTPTPTIPIIPTTSTNSTPTATKAATIEEQVYDDPFAGLQLSPPPSVSSSDENGAGPETNKKSQVTNDEQKKTEPVFKQTKSMPSATKIMGTHTQASSQVTHPALKKEVSFSNNLTRGRSMSYSPHEDEKGVRFSTSLVRGEGSGYNDSTEGRNSSHASAPGHPESSRRAMIDSTSQSVPTKQFNHAALGNIVQPENEAAATDLDIHTESDDSFTDIVIPLKRTVETEPKPRRHSFDPPSYRHTAGKNISARPPGSMQVNVSASRDGYTSDFDDKKDYAAESHGRDKRRKKLDREHTSFGKFDVFTRKETGTTAPTYNRRGHRLQPHSVEEGLLGNLSSHSWPEPIFIWKDGQNTPSVPGRSKPMFALCEKSESQNNIPGLSRHKIGLSSKGQVGQRYQPPSAGENAVNEGELVWSSS
ncbi:MAG: hypothetical protein Q9200_001333 [Gallowayella weberi]